MEPRGRNPSQIVTPYAGVRSRTQPSPATSAGRKWARQLRTGRRLARANPLTANDADANTSPLTTRPPPVAVPAIRDTRGLRRPRCAGPLPATQVGKPDVG